MMLYMIDVDSLIANQAERLGKRQNTKTVFPPMKAIIDDFDKIARDLNDVKTVICCIAFQQDDRTLSIPFTSLAAMPKGIELEISADHVHGNYIFKAILPGEERDDSKNSSSGDAPDDQAAGG